MQDFMILAIIGTEKLIVDRPWQKGRTDRWTDGILNSYIAPCYNEVR